jgi:hypothetical protein
VSPRSIWLTRAAAILIVVWAFGSYGLSRHSHEPFPTGRLPGFENAPVRDGVTSARDLVIVVAFGDRVAEFQPDDFFGDAGVSLDRVLLNRLRTPFEPTSGLSKLTWNLVGPGSPLRRDQPLNYRESPDTAAKFIEIVETLEGETPVSITIRQDTLKFDTGTGALLETETILAATICEECTS